MATYKKRGYKPKTKEEKVVEEHIESTTAEVFDSLDETANKTEEWVEKNQKIILGAIVAILLVVLAYLGYQKFVAEPAEEEAANEMVLAQENFNTALETSNTKVKDSIYKLALNGERGKYGFLEIIENYGGTKSGNLARYYAGMTYLALNDYQNAIGQLEGFTSDDDMLEPLAKGAMGDAFMQLGQADEALEYYDKAIQASSNEFTTPRFLFKGAVTAIETGDNAKAVSYLNRIKDEFKDSDYASQVDLYLGKAQGN